ncbi:MULTISPECIES: general stress protein [unclassified Microbacterium]|uniref:general stress protein n=1 Tax=unclassified Microbacterium TaxID=2609290 RepID=UPI001E3B3B5A|nr:general stress protein [Microbacterium sp. MAH-37]
MSMLNRPSNGADVGELVSSVPDYENAQKTVSKLIAGEVPARDIAIVGMGVRTIERVTGRLGYAMAARSGAVNGVLIGLFLSAIMLFGNPDAPITLFLGFIFIGVALGMIMSLITFTIVRRRRDFASVTQLAADHYEVRVQPASLAKARQIVGAATRPEPVRPVVNLDEPPKYGERIDPDAAEQGAPPVAGGPEMVIPPRPAAPPLPPTPAPPAYGERVDASPESSPADAAPEPASAEAPQGEQGEEGAPEHGESGSPEDPRQGS